MTKTKTKMATTTDPQSTRKRLSFRRAVSAVAILAVLVVASGCTNSSEESGDPLGSADSSAPATSTTLSSTTTTVPINARGALASALDRYEGGYRFEAVASVGEAEAVTITGVVIGTSAEMNVASGDGVAEYIITPDGSWIRIDDGDWQEVTSSGPINPPIEDLRSPQTIKIVATNSDGFVAVAVYDGSAFESESSVDLELVFEDGLLVSASYTTEDASVTTIFSPLDGETIETPSATS